MRDPHQVVIHDICEVVGRIAVRLDEDHVVQLAVFDRDLPVDLVPEGRRPLGGHIEPDDIGDPCVEIRLNFLFGKMETVLVIGRDLLAGYDTAQALKTLLRAEAVIRRTLFDQDLRVLFVDALLRALALHIGTDAAVLVRSFVKGKAGQVECPVNDLKRAFIEAYLICVLDTEHEISVFMLCDQIGIERCAKISNMHPAGRAGCKPCLYHKSYLLEKNFSHLYLPVWTESPHRSFSCRLNLIMRDTERAMAISIMRKSTDVPP